MSDKYTILFERDEDDRTAAEYNGLPGEVQLARELQAACDDGTLNGTFEVREGDSRGDAAAFVQAVLDTDAITVEMAQAGEEPIDATDVACVVDAILRGDRFRGDPDMPVVRWARGTFGEEYFDRVFDVQTDGRAHAPEREDGA